MRKLDLRLRLHLHRKYRSYFEIIASLIEAAKDNSVGRFSLMKHTGTNCKHLKKYLASLTEIGFIRRDIKEGRVLYRASDKGLAFLGQYYVLQEMLLGTRVKPHPTMITQILPQLKKRAL